MTEPYVYGYRYCQEHQDWVIAREYNESASMCFNCSQVAEIFDVEVEGRVFKVDRRKIAPRREDRSVSLPAYRAAMKLLKEAHPDEFRELYLSEKKRIAAEREVIESVASAISPQVDVLNRLDVQS